MGIKWCQRADLNHRPRAYESPALPLSYSGSRQRCIIWPKRALLSMAFAFWGVFCQNIACQGWALALVSAAAKEMDRKVKAETISEFGTHEKDTGSADVQIAVLSRRIKHLEGHLKANKKDHHSRRGLLIMVSRRKRLLRYLQGKDVNHMTELKKQLGIR